MKSTHFWLPSARSLLENTSFTPGKTLSVREIRLFCKATTFFMYKLNCRETSFSCSLIASTGAYSRRSIQLSSPYLAIFLASALSVLTLRMEPPPLCLMNSGFITVTRMPCPSPYLYCGGGWGLSPPTERGSCSSPNALQLCLLEFRHQS